MMGMLKELWIGFYSSDEVEKREGSSRHTMEKVPRNNF